MSIDGLCIGSWNLVLPYCGVTLTWMALVCTVKYVRAGRSVGEGFRRQYLVWEGLVEGREICFRKWEAESCGGATTNERACHELLLRTDLLLNPGVLR
jgi:hypothetical protein